MVQLKIYFLFIGFSLSIVFIGCTKDVDTNPYVPYNYCQFYSKISSDTSYIPHKKKNSWAYCSGDINYAGWNAGISLDTIINNQVYFDRTYYTNSSHAPYSYVINKSIIDSSGNYFSITNQSGYFDTLLLIKPNALNGDTIYNNQFTHVKIVLKNNNETVGTVTNCYHSLVIYPNGFSENHFFKKGIGELYYCGFKLYEAKIN